MSQYISQHVYHMKWKWETPTILVWFWWSFSITDQVKKKQKDFGTTIIRYDHMDFSNKIRRNIVDFYKNEKIPSTFDSQRGVRRWFFIPSHFIIFCNTYHRQYWPCEYYSPPFGSIYDLQFSRASLLASSICFLSLGSSHKSLISIITKTMGTPQTIARYMVSISKKPFWVGARLTIGGWLE